LEGDHMRHAQLTASGWGTTVEIAEINEAAIPSGLTVIVGQVKLATTTAIRITEGERFELSWDGAKKECVAVIVEGNAVSFVCWKARSG
jgi:predicted RecA/RadA family phage recombinase